MFHLSRRSNAAPNGWPATRVSSQDIKSVPLVANPPRGVPLVANPPRGVILVTNRPRGAFQVHLSLASHGSTLCVCQRHHATRTPNPNPHLNRT